MSDEESVKVAVRVRPFVSFQILFPHMLLTYCNLI